jgi:DNA-binding transcriptional LysR family regulator
VSFPEPYDARLAIDRVFATHGVRRRTQLESQLSLTIMALVEQGLGVALIDPISAHYARGRVAVRKFEPLLPRRVYLATPNGQPLSALGAAFVRVVRRRLDALPGI